MSPHHFDIDKLEKQFRESTAQGRREYEEYCKTNPPSPENRAYVEMQFELDDLIVLPLLLWHARREQAGGDQETIAQVIAEKLSLMIVNLATNLYGAPPVGSLRARRNARSIMDYIEKEVSTNIVGADDGRAGFKEAVEIPPASEH